MGKKRRKMFRSKFVGHARSRLNKTEEIVVESTTTEPVEVKKTPAPKPAEVKKTPTPQPVEVKKPDPKPVEKKKPVSKEALKPSNKKKK